MKVIYSTNYVLRDLYVLLYKGKYLMVYRSSGLNEGRAGRFLPFDMLGDPPRATMSSVTPGYIYKEFYFDGRFINHRKEPHRLSPAIGPFLLEIEEFLADKIPPEVPHKHIKSYKDLLTIARPINVELNKAIGDLKPFDWVDLNEGDL